MFLVKVNVDSVYNIYSNASLSFFTGVSQKGGGGGPLTLAYKSQLWPNEIGG